MHVERLVSCGPRPSGSEALQKAGDYIVAQLMGYGLEVTEQIFDAATPRGAVKFRNIIGKTRETSDGRVVIVASHYDTKWMPDITMLGANDGGSSVGVVLEVARVAAAQPNIWFVFFDGEEAMAEYGPDDGLWGSKHFVRELNAEGRAGVERIKAMVLLDMVGDVRLNIGIPRNGTGWLVELVFDAARATGHRDYFSLYSREILDDHVPFLNAGIPAVDLIDFEYGSAPGLNDYWHTEQDTLDKISPRSLGIVGKTVLELLTKLRSAEAAS